MKDHRFTFNTVLYPDGGDLEVRVQALATAHLPATHDSPEEGGHVIIEKITDLATGIEITSEDFLKRNLTELTVDANTYLLKETT